MRHRGFKEGEEAGGRVVGRVDGGGEDVEEGIGGAWVLDEKQVQKPKWLASELLNIKRNLKMLQ